MKNKFIRIDNGIYSPEFIAANKGKKLIIYPLDMGKPSVAPEDKDGEFIGISYSWGYTPTATVYLNDNETVQTGSDGDYVVLESDNCVIYFGRSLGGYILLQWGKEEYKND